MKSERCSNPTCRHPDDEDLLSCEECRRPICAQHWAQYSCYVLCQECHHADDRRLESLQHTITIMLNDARNYTFHTEQNGRRWAGFVGCEDILERLMRGITDGTLVEAVTQGSPDV